MKVKNYYFMLVLVAVWFNRLLHKKRLFQVRYQMHLVYRLPGATVLIKGTTTGTSTDFDGKYSISASQGATLVFSFVGYTTQEINVGASNTINITMTEDAEALEEVVVTALGIKRNERSLGYSVNAD